MRSKRAVFSYFAVCAVMNVGMYAVHPVVPSLIQKLQLPDFTFGLALAMMLIMTALFSPFWSLVCGYISSRSTMLITCLGYALGQALYGAANGMAMVLIGRAVAGIFMGGIYVAGMDYIINTSPEELRGKYLTLNATVMSVGGTFGYFAGGMLGEISIGAAFLFQVLVIALSGIAFFFVCCPDAFKNRDEFDIGEVFRVCNPVSALAAGKTFMSFTWAKLFLTCCLSYMSYTVFDNVFNYYIRDQFGLGSGYYGTLQFIVGLIALVVNPTIGMHLVQRTDIRKNIIPVLFLGAAAIFGTILSPHLYLYFVLGIVFFIFNTLIGPLRENLVANRAERRQSNLIMGFYQTIFYIGGVVGSLLAGFLYELVPESPFYMAGAGLVVAGISAAMYYADCRKEERERAGTEQ